MDAKITKTRLGQLLSYEWIKILLFIVIAIVVWSLVFTMTATRITPTQTYSIVNFYGTNFGTKISENYYGYKGNVFSYEVMECSVVDVLAGGDDYVGTLLETRFVTSEGDVLFAANVNNPESKTAKTDENGNEIKNAEGETEYEYTTYLQQFLKTTYFHDVVRLDDTAEKDGYFTQMKKYLAGFYQFTETEKTFGEVTLSVADFDENTLDTATVERLFRERVARNKDKRFKKEAQIQQGIADEIKRIQSYCEGYETIFEYLEKGYISFTVSSVQMTETVTYTGAYSLNLCPNEDTMGGLKNFVYHIAQDENGKNYTTAKDINALFLLLDGVDTDFQYETVLLINQFVKEACSEIN